MIKFYTGEIEDDQKKQKQWPRSDEKHAVNIQ